MYYPVHGDAVEHRRTTQAMRTYTNVFYFDSIILVMMIIKIFILALPLFSCYPFSSCGISMYSICTFCVRLSDSMVFKVCTPCTLSAYCVLLYIFHHIPFMCFMCRLVVLAAGAPVITVNMYSFQHAS